jgi:hypothetical protein
MIASCLDSKGQSSVFRIWSKGFVLLGAIAQS